LPGKLLLIATPVGNLSDISARVENSLRESDYILAEDTRVSIKILNHLKIKKRMVSCHEFNESARTSLIAEANQTNKTVALLSDAGTPLISDPGFEIVQAAIACGMQVIPIPGPSAFVLALIGSGLPCNRFVFEGFLPDKPGAAKQRLTELANESRTIILYVAPHKLARTLTLFKGILGDRQACVARELTKIHEQFLRGTLSELGNFATSNKILGECVLVVAGSESSGKSQRQAIVCEDSIVNAMEKMRSQGLGVKEISIRCAKQFGLKRSHTYQLALRCVKKVK
jgi:16S rRNA (cytidine1402-2'-O)-methyltransferase